MLYIKIYKLLLKAYFVIAKYHSEKHVVFIINNAKQCRMNDVYNNYNETHHVQRIN